MSDTPRTQTEWIRANSANERGIEIAYDMCDFARNLERQHNALIAKLEALAKEYATVKDDTGILVAAAYDINLLIQEAKQ